MLAQNLNGVSSNRVAWRLFLALEKLTVVTTYLGINHNTTVEEWENR